MVGAGAQVTGRLRGCAARGASRPIELDKSGARGGGGWQEQRAKGVRGREGGGRRGATWEGAAEKGSYIGEDHVWFEDWWMVASLCDE
jgi:hypothetical protein